MVLFHIILAVVVVVGALSFKAQITDSANTISAGTGCAGILILAVGLGVMLSLLVREFGREPRLLLLAMLATGGVVAVLYSPFMANFAGSVFERVIYPTGGGEIKSYDIAEKLTKEGRYAEAVAEYEKAIGEEPEDVNPRILIADVYCKSGQYDQAAQSLTEALDQDLAAEKWCHIANRLADIFAQMMYEPLRATEILRRIVERYPHTKFARYAQERIARIAASRLNSGDY